MAADTSRLFVTAEGEGLRFFLDPSQIQKDKRRELLGLIRNSGGVYVPSPTDADVILSALDAEEAENYAREHKAKAVVDFDWVNYCLSKRVLAAGGDWAGFRIKADEDSVPVKREELLVNSTNLVVNNKLPSPVSPGLQRPPSAPSTSPVSHGPANGTSIANSTARTSVEAQTRAELASLSPAARPPPKPMAESNRGLLDAIARILPQNAALSPAKLSLSAASFASRSSPLSPNVPPSAGATRPNAKNLNTSQSPVSAAGPSNSSGLGGSRSTATAMAQGSTSRLPTPSSLPSPRVKAESVTSSQSAGTPDGVPLFTHPTEPRPLKVYLVPDLSHHKDFARILQANGAELSHIMECDYAIVDQGSVRLHLVAGSKKPAVKPEWIHACCRQKRLLPPDTWLLKLDDHVQMPPIVRAGPTVPTKGKLEPAPSSSNIPSSISPSTPKLAIPNPPKESAPSASSISPTSERASSSKSNEKREDRAVPTTIRDSPPPLPPTKFQKSRKGNAFTQEDEDFFYAYRAWRRRRTPHATDYFILGEIAAVAPHHSETSWKNWYWRNTVRHNRLVPDGGISDLDKQVATGELEDDEDLVIYNDLDFEASPQPPASNQDVGPPPDPPKSFLPRTDGRGVQYTDVDEAYVVALGRWMLRQNPHITLRDVSEEVSKRADHHSPTGWFRHISLYRKFYTEHIFGLGSEQALSLSRSESSKYATSAPSSETAGVPAAKVVKKRKSTAESLRPRKTHKATDHASALYSFPQPTHRRGSVAFTEADLQLLVDHIEKFPLLDRGNDKVWIRFSEEHPHHSLKEWMQYLKEHSELIDHELEIRKQEIEDELAEEEEEEVDMEIGDSD